MAPFVGTANGNMNSHEVWAIKGRRLVTVITTSNVKENLGVTGSGGRYNGPGYNVTNCTNETVHS